MPDSWDEVDNRNLSGFAFEVQLPDGNLPVGVFTINRTGQAKPPEDTTTTSTTTPTSTPVSNVTGKEAKQEEAASSTPKTGDNNTLCISLMIISILGLVATTIFTKPNS